MGKFSNRTPEQQGQRQATSVMKEMQGDKIASVGTVRNYEQALKSVATALAHEGKDLKSLTPETAKSYLENRAEEVGQKSLDMERQAIQAMMTHVTNELAHGEKLEVVKSHHEQVLNSRAYTPEQVQAVADRQGERNAIATELAHAAGLRAHELLTIEKAEIRPADERPADSEKFSGRSGEIYTVEGKGGLVREVLIPSELAARLEDRRLEEPREVTDRGINYEQNYDIAGGKAWSNSFSAASERALGWSEGGHGLRHSFAQERMEELRDPERENGHLDREHALTVVSQEMGHFRPEITEVYLR
jgi:integrase